VELLSLVNMALMDNPVNTVPSQASPVTASANATKATQASTAKSRTHVLW